MAKRIQVLLLESIKSVGVAGDIVAVSEGYARNFLFPQGKAALATSHVVTFHKRKKAKVEAQQQAELAQLQEVAEQLEGTELAFTVKVKEGNAIFGSITPKKIADALEHQANLEVTAKDVLLPKPLTTLGTHSVTVRLSPDVETTLAVSILADPTSLKVKEEE